MSPKTISFYGGLDLLVPGANQGTLLRNRLNLAGVYNEDFFYGDEGHGLGRPENQEHMLKKMQYFFQAHM